MMELLRPGILVELQNNITALVISVMIKTNEHVQYEVTWNHEGVRRCEWVDSYEILAFHNDPCPKMQIGFKTT